MDFGLYGAALYIASCLLFLLAVVTALIPVRMARDNLPVIEGLVVLVVIAVASFDIAHRPVDVQGDTSIYIAFFNDLNSGIEGISQTFEPGFIALMRLFGVLDLDYVYFFYIIAFGFLWSYYLLAKAIFGRQSVWPLIVFAVLMFYPFFLSLTANTIRQGVALCFVNLALASSVKIGWRKGNFFSLCAVFFHKSTIVFLPFFMFRRVISKISVYSVVSIWLLVSVASYLKLFSFLVSMLFGLLAGYGLVLDYSDAGSIDYVIGFRWDFWLFSSVSIFLLIYVKLIGMLNRRDAYIFYICAFLSCLHIAMFDVAYNDRFGIYSWIFYPLELGYVIRATAANIIEGRRLAAEAADNTLV